MESDWKKFDDVFGYLIARKKLLEILHDLNKQVSCVEERLKILQKPFYKMTVNVDLYREFFKKYYIALNNDTERYVVKKIEVFDNGEEKFYDVVYNYVNDNSPNDNHENANLSLRKFMNLLDNSDAELKKFSIPSGVVAEPTSER